MSSKVRSISGKNLAAIPTKCIEANTIVWNQSKCWVVGTGSLWIDKAIIKRILALVASKSTRLPLTNNIRLPGYSKVKQVKMKPLLHGRYDGGCLLRSFSFCSITQLDTGPESVDWHIYKQYTYINYRVWSPALNFLRKWIFRLAEAADDSVNTRVAATRKFKFRDFRWPSVAWFAYPWPNLGCWPFHSHYHFSFFLAFNSSNFARCITRCPGISQRSRGKPRKLVKLHQKRGHTPTRRNHPSPASLTPDRDQSQCWILQTQFTQNLSSETNERKTQTNSWYRTKWLTIPRFLLGQKLPSICYVAGKPDKVQGRCLFDRLISDHSFLSVTIQPKKKTSKHKQTPLTRRASRIGPFGFFVGGPSFWARSNHRYGTSIGRRLVTWWPTN